MKENRKGFTLIELLAVIVILAIIALIATPIIMGVIEDAREGARKDAALGYGHAVEAAIATQLIKCPNLKVKAIGPDAMELENCTDDEITGNNFPINYQGTKPTKTDEVRYDPDTGKVTGSVTFGEDAKVKYDVQTGAATEISREEGGADS